MDQTTGQTAAKSNLSIPGAIIVAGLFIAGAIYLSGRTHTPAQGSASDVKTADITFAAVSPKEHILGNPNAPVTIVEFSDLECPYCKVFQSTLNSIMNTYGKNGKVAWVYRQFPIASLHSRAEKEAEASECAAELGGNEAFWKYINEVFTTTTSNNTLDPAKLPVIAKDVGLDVTAFNTCVASGKYADKIQSQIAEAENAGAQGTPFSLLILTTPLSSATSDSLKAYIATNGLGANVFLSSNNAAVALSGALPSSIVTKILDTVLQ